MKMSAFSTGALVVVLLTSCAAPQTVRPAVDAAAVATEQHRQTLFVLESRQRDYERVYNIVERLRAANADLCPETEQSIGVRFETVHDYARENRAAAAELWDLAEQPTVLWVAVGSPAAEAGVRARDRLVSINGQRIEPGRRASRVAFRQMREAAQRGVVALDVERGDGMHTVSIEPVRRCRYDFYLTDDAEANAFADGDTIYINRGILQVARTDEELALVIGHELAHNAMGHLDARRQNAMMGTIGGAALDVLAALAGVNTGGAFSNAGGDIGARMFAQAFESEADYVGLYFVQRAGYPIDGVEEFWRRMALEHPRGIRFAYTHPTTAERFLGLAAARSEIAAKIVAGQPLVPNMRRDQDDETHAIAPVGAPPEAPNEASPPAPATPPPAEPILQQTDANASEAASTP